jgi:hypothetical protein
MPKKFFKKASEFFNLNIYSGFKTVLLKQFSIFLLESILTFLLDQLSIFLFEKFSILYVKKLLGWQVHFVPEFNLNLVLFIPINFAANCFVPKECLWRCTFLLTRIPGNRVARFLLVHDTKTGKNVPNEYKMYQMVIKYPKCP